MLRINELKLTINHDENDIKSKIQKLLNTREAFSFEIIRKSLDARNKANLMFSYVVDIKIANEDKVLKRADKRVTKYSPIKYSFPYKIKDIENKLRPVIIGMGPGGLFAGLYLARSGFRPIILERGKNVDERTKDVNSFWDENILNKKSNVQFGEGGAGTFSDGKLNTLVKEKSGRNRAVLKDFVSFGAPENILYEAKPHIGTDILKDVVKNIRNEIIALGGEVYFEECVTDFIIQNNKIKELVINDDEKIEVSNVILAIGHSARDTFETLYKRGLNMEPKSFAVGFRVSHDTALINNFVYGKAYDDKLMNESYKVTYKCEDGRGVYSFCMCPGGYVVNASSEENMLCINGMSYHNRASRKSNSAIIITIDPADYMKNDNPLSGMYFQREIEKKAFEVGEGNIPVETFGEFENRELDDTVNPDTEAKGNTIHSCVHNIMPEFINKDFVEGMHGFSRIISNFDAPDTVVYGIEGRTSSPIRMIRNDECMSNIKNLYVCGEGAGYAGGIMSAAMDGIKVSEEIAKSIIRMNTCNKRDSIDLSVRENKSKLIREKILKNFVNDRTDNYLVYVSFRSEVDTLGLISELLKLNKNVFCPKVHGTEMDFYKIASVDELHRGYMGIPEPNDDEKNRYVFEEFGPAVMLAPGTVFDMNCSRMGYGGGFYDRYLNKNSNIVKIGICFEEQIYYNSLARARFDVPMDVVVTDERIINVNE